MSGSVQFLLAYKKEYNLTWARGYVGSPSSYILLPPSVAAGTTRTGAEPAAAACAAPTAATGTAPPP